MRIFFISIFMLILVACGSDSIDNNNDYYQETSQQQLCGQQKTDAANACYDSNCEGYCAGFSCLFCWSSCLTSSESTYISCCITEGCTQIISGVVKDSSGTGVDGVQLTLDDMLPQYTDTYGNYSFLDTNGGTLTPSKQGLCFSPESRTYIQDYKNHTSENFTAKATCYSISGKITLSDLTAVSGITVELTGTSSGTTVTNTTGDYYFNNLTSGTYTVTPTHLTITPVSRSITIETTNATDQDFVVVID